MKKQDLIKAIALDADLNPNQAERALDATLRAILSSLKDGDSVNLPNFGSFNVTTRAERQGRNPQTGEAITIPSAMVVKFKPSRNLKTAVNY